MLISLCFRIIFIVLYLLVFVIIFTEEELIPMRRNEMGSACSSEELEDVDRLRSEEWQEIIPRTELRPGYEPTRHNYQKVNN